MAEQKTWTQLAFERLIGEHVAPTLKERGYRKFGLTWRIRREEPVRGWGVVNVQKSQWCTRDEISFTMNVGVWWDEAPDAPRKLVGKGPAEMSCHVRERIGFLADDPGDRWWKIDGGRWGYGEGPDCLAPIVKELMPLLEDRGLLWISRRLSGRSLAAYARAHKKIQNRVLEARR